MSPTPGLTAHSDPVPDPDHPLQAVVQKNIRLDPALADDEDSQRVDIHLYEGLIRLLGNNPTPHLALAWTVSEDGLDYTFELRPGILFHNGAPFNADAVVANFNRWFDPENPLHGNGRYKGWEDVFLGFKGDTDANNQPKSYFNGIEKVNDQIITIHLNRPMPDLLSDLSKPYFAIVNPDVLAAEGETYGTQGSILNGTGLYYLGEWTDKHIILEPFVNYWGGSPAIPLEFPILLIGQPE
jgi:peptide/nickel transport system substrate-binding protein